MKRLCAILACCALLVGLAALPAAAKPRQITKAKPETTDILFILDESGSMFGLSSDTIGGYNSFIEKQKKEPGEARLTTVLFNSTYRVLGSQVDLKRVPLLTSREYSPTSTTALYDAVGRAVSDLKKSLQEEGRASEKVIVLIVTDGQENSSVEFRLSQVQKLIADCRKSGWEFVYMGANVESAKEASSIGISRKNAMDFAPSANGLQNVFDSAQEAVKNFRSTGDVGKWQQSDDSKPVKP